MLDGSYGLGVICEDNPGELIAARKDSPLILGVGEGENYIASDVPAILEYTRNVYFLEDHDIAVVKENSIEIYDEYNLPVERDVFKVEWDAVSAEKGGYKHFMIKEIHEEPKALRDTLSPRLKGTQINLDEIKIDEEMIRNISRVIIVACGTAYHAGVVAKYAFEEMLRLPVEIDIASEYKYRTNSW